MTNLKADDTADAATLKKIVASVNRQELVAVIGTGVSLALTELTVRALSWRGLITEGLQHARLKGRITADQEQSWIAKLNLEDIDELLVAAEFMGRKLDAPSGDLYVRWLRGIFDQVTPTHRGMIDAISAIHAAQVPLCTLNYDTLLEQVTGLPTIHLTDHSQVNDWMRRLKPGVFHLHGSWKIPTTCILGIRDYETTLGSQVRNLIQQSLSSFKRLLFIGCGDTFSDPNFQALVTWLKKNMHSATPQHYALVSANEVGRRHADPHWQGFVEPLSYGEDHGKLPEFILRLFPTSAKRTVESRALSSVTANQEKEHESVLEVYRSFLVKDCGDMTFEGVPTDIDMAQRKFNLERLFVPLTVLPCLPGKSSSELKHNSAGAPFGSEGEELPTRESFGKVFARRHRLALLALPGAGKSLLLKRLAVAYSDETRRQSCADDIPPLDVIPVLIRCREWRDYIRLPILSLLRKMPEITGYSVLADFCEALLPRLRQGQALLLVDGLDEIHNDADRTTFVEHLESFLSEFKKIRLVVTSRAAGFGLVAPGLARFCDQFRIAPLDREAIQTLCEHWHKLIAGDTPESAREALEFASYIEQNAALQRLAENPLLLTMILVVKHGAGRLPPDRVTLYARAVEVLLDTWNIKGHAPLNSKEAVPQLAYVAFELTRAGKQTVTQRELLRLLENAREKVTQVRLYAKDTPAEFLKRVELRSSLLVEGGHLSEGGRAVPFYQFRHLTFQEYLTAVAVVDAHYAEYRPTDTILTPMAPFLSNSKWKEVVPMAAVLAGQQAEPLLALLTNTGQIALNQNFPILDPGDYDEYTERRQPVERLLDCLAEEAQGSSETITAALQLIALTSDPAQRAQLVALGRGPYGKEFFRQVEAIYRDMKWKNPGLGSTFALLAGAREPLSYWLLPENLRRLERQIESVDEAEVVLGLMTAISLWWGTDYQDSAVLGPLFARAEKCLYSDSGAVQCIAAWVYGVGYTAFREHTRPPAVALLERLLALWLHPYPQGPHHFIALAMSSMVGIPRGMWTPSLTPQQVEQVVALSQARLDDENYDYGSAIVVAFHARTVWSDTEVEQRLGHLLSVDPNGQEFIVEAPDEQRSTGAPYLDESDSGMEDWDMSDD